MTDGRFSGGTSGLSIGHVSPEAGEGGAIALIEEGDRIRIDIPGRKIDVLVSDSELELRRQKMLAKGKDAFRPNRDRYVSQALQAYALMATSAARGAVRDISQLNADTTGNRRAGLETVAKDPDFHRESGSGGDPRAEQLGGANAQRPLRR